MVGRPGINFQDRPGFSLRYHVQAVCGAHQASWTVDTTVPSPKKSSWSVKLHYTLSSKLKSRMRTDLHPSVGTQFRAYFISLWIKLKPSNSTKFICITVPIFCHFFHEYYGLIYSHYLSIPLQWNLHDLSIKWIVF